MYLSCPALTSFPAIFAGKLSNVLYFIQIIKVVIVIVFFLTGNDKDGIK